MTYTSLGQIPTRFVNLPAARAAFGDRVDRFAPFLLKGDPLADEAMGSLKTEANGRPAKEMFGYLDLGARQGFRAIPEAPEALRAFFEAQERVPMWVDWETIARGGLLVLRTGLIGGLVLGAKSIVLGYASPGGNKPLIFAGGLTERAPKRLNETARYVRGVVMQDGLRPPQDGRPAGEGYVASCKVRLMHAQVRSLLLSDPRWRTSDWGVPINQHDMVATTLLFSLVLAEGLDTLGVRVDREEAEEYTHLWRYAGHLMGVDDELLPSRIAEAKSLRDLIFITQGPPDDDSRALVTALVNAAPVEAEMPREKRDAERSSQLLRAAAYELLGPDMATALGFDPTPLRHALPVLRRLIRGSEHTRRIGALRDAQLRIGRRYWDDIATLGLRLYGTPFHVPEALSKTR